MPVGFQGIAPVIEPVKKCRQTRQARLATACLFQANQQGLPCKRFNYSLQNWQPSPGLRLVLAEFQQQTDLNFSLLFQELLAPGSNGLRADLMGKNEQKAA